MIVALLILIFTTLSFAEDPPLLYGFYNPQKELILLEPTAMTQPFDSNYVVYTGDLFEFSLKMGNFAGVVNPEGYVTMGIFGSAKVNGLTLAEAKKIMRDKIAEQNGPKGIHITLAKMRNISIYVSGAVINPSSLTVPNYSRLSQILQYTGGPLKSADLDSILVIRNKDTLTVNLNHIGKDGLLDEDLFLEQYDHIHVPYLDLENNAVIWTYISGNITPLKYVKGRKIMDYLKYAGLLKSLEGIQGLILTNKDKKSLIEFNKFGQLEVDSGDTIDVITKSNSIYISGSVTQPGAQPYNITYRPIDYIFNAGIGPIAEDVNYITIRRLNGDIENIDPENSIIYPGEAIYVDRSNFEYTKDWVNILGGLASVLSVSILAYQVFYLSK